MYPFVWYLPCNETPFLNRNHPVFLAIKDRVVDCDEGRIRLKHFGWVTPAACCKTATEAEEELFHHYETLWLDRGDIQVKIRCSLRDFCRHSGHSKLELFGEKPLQWFDLRGILNDQHNYIEAEAVIDIEAFMRP